MQGHDIQITSHSGLLELLRSTISVFREEPILAENSDEK